MEPLNHNLDLALRTKDPTCAIPPQGRPAIQHIAADLALLLCNARPASLPCVGPSSLPLPPIWGPADPQPRGA